MSETDWAWLRSEVGAAAETLAARLARFDDSSAWIPRMGWTVADLAAHLITMPGLYQDLDQLGSGFTRPENWDRFSRSARAHLSETDPGRLASMLVTEAELFLAELGPDPERPRTVYGQATTSANVAAGFLGELILHREDLDRLPASAAGASPDDPVIGPRQAHAILAQYMALAPAFVDPDKARRCEGVFHLRLRGGTDYTHRVADGALTVSPGRPDRADGRVVADPVPFLYVSTGRRNPLWPVLRGQIVSWGRKPWLLARFGNITVDDI